MANSIVTFKVMPESPEVDLEAIKEKAIVIAKEQGAKGNVATEIQPIAFGLSALKVLGMFGDENGCDVEGIAAKMAEIEDVQSAEVEKVDLAMG
jgi:elongation factor 1-beta